MSLDISPRHAMLLTVVFPQQRVVRWLKSLQELSLSPIVFCGRFSDSDLWSYKCDIRTYAGSLKFPWSRARVRSILEYLYDNSVSLQLIICRDIFLAETAAEVSRLTGIPWILDIADNYPELAMDPTNGLAQKHVLAHLLNFVERRACNRASALTFVSDTSRALVVEKHQLRQGPPTFVVPNLPMRQDLIGFSPIAQTRPENDSSHGQTLRCVYIGAYDQRVRDFSPIVNAALRLRTRGVFVRVDVYAKDPSSLRAYYRSLAAGAKEHLRILEPVPRTQLNAVLATYDVGLIPHRRSPATDYTVPNKMYDYILAGIPFLASDNPSLLSIARRLPYGVFYSPDNEESVISALENLLENSATYKKRLSLESAWLREELTWEVAFKRELSGHIKGLLDRAE